LLPEAILVERFLGLNISSEAPSKISQLEDYKKLQKNSKQRILDNRPSADRFIPPISLLYDGFGAFDDVLQGKPADRENKILMLPLWERVGNFLKQMAKFYDTEAPRQDTIIQCLNSEVIGKIHTSKIGSC
jgi:hypothetical protein